ncbi:hypothetical protein NMG60_11016147 [Bertholletia excelsa]
MALRSFLPDSSELKVQPSKCKPRPHHQKHHSSWDQIKNLFTCKQIERTTVHDPSNPSGGYAKLGSWGYICSFNDVVRGNTRVVHRADNSPESSYLGQQTQLLTRKSSSGSVSTPSLSGSARSNGSGVSYGSSSSRALQLRKLSGCYECRTIVDPRRYPSSRTTICACSECGEVFRTIENLELHQAARHAVSELGPEDSGRNIVEIIFKSSWLKKDNPIGKIERILKVHSTQRTIQRFEDCREAVKTRANSSARRNARCAADGNELLRFYCATLTCSLGARGSSNLCAGPSCGVCAIIRHGFAGEPSDGRGICTTASSGRAHDCLGGGSARRAMLVCRVIAGRVRRMVDDASPLEDGGMSPGSYDSVSGCAGVYSNLEELYVFNPRAILPCFVVIYSALLS